MRHLNLLRQFLDAIEWICFYRYFVFRNYIQHPSSLVRRANERSFDSNVPENEFVEWYLYILRLQHVLAR